MNIGLLGGSFNPVHTQHINIAKAALATNRFDEIWFVPVFLPVHKDDGELLEFDVRANFLEIALAEIPRCKVCYIESELGGLSYTIRTVKALKSSFPGHSFSLIIGGDSLSDLPTWRSIDELLKLVNFYVVARPGTNIPEVYPGTEIHWIDLEMNSVSSTEIRNLLSRQEFAELELPPGVFYEILVNGHYDSLSVSQKQLLNIVLKEQVRMPKGLLEHVESVANHIIEYCFEYGIDPFSGVIAALAHDIFRASSNEEILSFCAEKNVDLHGVEAKIPMLAHGRVAAAFLESLPNIEVSLDIIEAVKSHTFPPVEAADLTKALVLADTLDSTRADKEKDRLRNLNISADEKYLKVVQLKKRIAEIKNLEE